MEIEEQALEELKQGLQVIALQSAELAFTLMFTKNLVCTSPYKQLTLALKEMEKQMEELESSL